jgi:hypothetical protein
MSLESQPDHDTLALSFYEEEAQEVLLLAAHNYKEIALQDIDFPNPDDKQIVGLAIAEDDTQRLDALVRARVLESYADLLHEDYVFRENLLADDTFKQVTAEEYPRQVFVELIDLALKELPAYCERLIQRRKEKRNAWQVDDAPTEEFVPDFGADDL